jgi:serine/threonine protein kinase
MPLKPGTRLGPYEILALLGAGGIGEVYRARDPRLAREVAIKILIESFAADADRLRRFELEARAIAALNHPNILSVHDLGSLNGTQYPVSELLEGSTLRDKLRSRLPQRRTIEYAAQLAKGLAAAHERGIVHRDLKPENIFITNNGHLKILDFGLAKQTGIQKTGADETTLAATDHTSAGVLLGTVGYMSPEQVRGGPVDARTDIFAFGAVLYEMLTGLRAFKRNSSVETMTAILKEEPSEMSSTGDAFISPGLQRVVRHCLEKHPSQRFQSAKDLTFALENLDVNSSSIQAAAILNSARGSNPWRIATLALSALVLIALALGFHMINARPSPPVFKQVTFRKGSVNAARFAPDGHTIVYSAAWDKPSPKVFSSRDDGNEVRELGLVGYIQSVSRSGELAVILDMATLLVYR